MKTLGNLLLPIVPNAGQADSRALYQTRGAGFQFYFGANDVTLVFTNARTDEAPPSGIALRLRFVDSSAEIKPQPRLEAPGKANFLLGSDTDRWLTNLPTYHELLYQDVWPGIDLIFRGEAGELKYDLVVSPGARLKDIRLEWRGATDVTVSEAGQLLIQTPLGVLTEAIPRSYQEIAGMRVPVSARFVLHRRTDEGTEFGFALEDGYDARHPLVIDPTILYSTYLGGSGFDEPHSIAVDAAGNAYVAGVTASTNFPVTPGAFQVAYGGDASDAFIKKIDPTGTALIYSTYLGGTGSDEADDIEVDAAGVAYVTGRTNSTDFPTTPDAFSLTLNGPRDAFVTQFNSTGTGLLFSTYLGGSGFEEGTAIAVNGAGDVYVTGETSSLDFPTTPGVIQPAFGGGTQDGFVTKMSLAVVPPPRGVGWPMADVQIDTDR